MLKSRSRASMFAAASALTLTVVSSQVQAQDAAQLAARRTLIEEAQAARQANDHATAADRAERALRIQGSPSLRLFLAQEQDALGRVAEAFGNADLCGREAEADRAMRNRETVMAACRALSTELRGRLGRVEVRAPSPAPQGLTVTVGGRAWDSALWGIPSPVSPGHVVIEASAPGYAAFRREIDVTAGSSTPVDITLTRSEGNVASNTSNSSNASSNNSSSNTGSGSETNPQRDTTPRRSVAPYVLLGAGGVGIVGAGVFLALRQLSHGMCASDGGCPSQSVINNVYGFSGAMLASGAIGIGCTIAGVVLLTRGNRSAATEPRAMLNVTPTPGGMMLSVGGAL